MTEVKTDIDFIKMAADITKIKQAVLGNGVPGLCQRVEIIEKIQKKQGYISGFCAGVGFVFGGCITWIINILCKGG